MEDINNVNKLSNSHPWQKESSLDLKFKQRYKVKIDKIQQYDPYQMKKEELSGDISKFLPLQQLNLLIVNYFLLFLNYLLKLPWLLDGSVRNIFLSSF